MTREERKRIEEDIETWMSFKRHPAFDSFMLWIDANTRSTFESLLTETDPTKLAKYVGSVAAYKNVKGRVEWSINALQESLKNNID